MTDLFPAAQAVKVGAIKERSILYSALMVCAILNNSKTQTRRVGKFRHDGGFPANPYGITGDRLWVRETWRVSSAHDNLPPSQIPKETTVEYLADGPGMLDGKTRPSIFMPRWASRITLEVTEVKLQLLQSISEADAQAEGVVALPLQAGQPGAWWSADPTQPALHGRSPIDAFQRLWESIYGHSSWLSNPIVRAISFQLIHSQSQHD
jgi:hypothetical protein